MLATALVPRPRLLPGAAGDSGDAPAPAVIILGRPLLALPRRHLYTLLAAVLAAGAPLGLLALRLTGPAEANLAVIRNELQRDASAYLYVTASTLAVFALFGYILGRQADVLVALSRIDSLTGLGNPLAFDERL